MNLRKKFKAVLIFFILVSPPILAPRIYKMNQIRELECLDFFFLCVCVNYASSINILERPSAQPMSWSPTAVFQLGNSTIPGHFSLPTVVLGSLLHKMLFFTLYQRCRCVCCSTTINSKTVCFLNLCLSVFQNSQFIY